MGWPLQRQVVRVSAESPSSSFAIRGTSGQSAHVLPAPSSALNREPDGPCPGSSIRFHSQKVPACTLVGCLCSSAAAAPERAAEFLGSTAPSASPLQPLGQSPAQSRPPTLRVDTSWGRRRCTGHRAVRTWRRTSTKSPRPPSACRRVKYCHLGFQTPWHPAGDETVSRKGHKVK